MKQAMGHDAVELVCGPLCVVTCVVPDTVDGDENVSGNPIGTGHGERENVRAVVVIEVPAIHLEHVVIAAKEVIQLAKRLTVFLGNRKKPSANGMALAQAKGGVLEMEGDASGVAHDAAAVWGLADSKRRMAMRPSSSNSQVSAN